MAPHDPKSKEGNPCKLKAGPDFPEKITKMKSKRLTTWVPFWRDTKFYCASCYTACTDPAQHFKQSATCGYSSAVTYLLHSLEQNHYADDFHPDPNIISIMLADDSCPMNPLDVLLQPSTWNPTQNFTICTHENSVHVNQQLQNTSFLALYNDFVKVDRIKPIVEALPAAPAWAPPDYVDLASESANSVPQYVLHRKREYDAQIDRAVRDRVQERIQAELPAAVQAEINRLVNIGRLTRTLPGTPHDRRVRQRNDGETGTQGPPVTPGTNV